MEQDSVNEWINSVETAMVAAGGASSAPESLGQFGSDVPFAEPYWYRGSFVSPYYTESHARFRAKVRAWIENDAAPFSEKWEEDGDYPRELHQKAYAAGVYGACWPEEYGGTPPDGPGTRFDAFHDLIFWDEIARGGGGWVAACFMTVNIALPPILALGSAEMKATVVPPLVRGEKIISLAITEPYAGSDVANIRTTARRDGDHYVISGEKKFITSGMKADYFTVAARTGGPGMQGITLFLVERTRPGITTRKLQTQGWASSNTAYIIFDEVRVPASNIIGQEGQGFLAIMLNFNHERFAGIVMAVRGGRACIEESVAYARNRMTFGKRLIDHQVIRHKIAEMARRVESSQAWLEQLTYQMEHNVDPRSLGGQLALLKVNVTKNMQYCAVQASQIFGGNSCLRQGVGSRVERIYRDVRIAAIGGGSEEVMIDLAMRQAKL